MAAAVATTSRRGPGGGQPMGGAAYPRYLGRDYLRRFRLVSHLRRGKTSTEDLSSRSCGQLRDGRDGAEEAAATREGFLVNRGGAVGWPEWGQSTDRPFRPLETSTRVETAVTTSFGGVQTGALARMGTFTRRKKCSPCSELCIPLASFKQAQGRTMYGFKGGPGS